MVQRVGGTRRKTRYKYKKDLRSKGKISLTRYFQELNEGQMVQLIGEPAIQTGMYHRRMHAKIGTIVGKQGSCYHVAVKDHNMTKTFIVHPVHLKAL